MNLLKVSLFSWKLLQNGYVSLRLLEYFQALYFLTVQGFESFNLFSALLAQALCLAAANKLCFDHYYQSENFIKSSIKNF